MAISTFRRKDSIIKKDKLVIVIGCGDIGSFVADYFSSKGYQVVVIDNNSSAFSNLSNDFSGFRMNGDATEPSVLLKAKVKDAYALVATTHNDSINLMACQVAGKVYKTPLVIARVDDVSRAKAYSKFGVKTICPTAVAAQLFIDEIKDFPENTEDNSQ